MTLRQVFTSMHREPELAHEASPRRAGARRGDVDQLFSLHGETLVQSHCSGNPHGGSPGPFAARRLLPMAHHWPQEACMEKLQQWRRQQEGKMGYILLWALGVPIPVLFVFFLLRGCT